MFNLTFSYSSKINGYLYLQRVSLPFKKSHDRFSESNAVYLVWRENPQIVIAVWGTKFEKVHQTAITTITTVSAEGCHTLPDHSAEFFVEGRRALNALIMSEHC
jgi:hypothetical protein